MLSMLEIWSYFSKEKVKSAERSACAELEMGMWSTALWGLFLFLLCLNSVLTPYIKFMFNFD